MGKQRDTSVIGKVFGKLKVISLNEEETARPGNSRSYWNCECECGNYCILRNDNLLQRNDLSCGCQSRNEFLSRIEKTEYTLITRYRINNSTRLIVEDRDGYRYDVLQAAIFDKDHIISPFHNGNAYTLYNIEKWINDNNKTFKLCDENEYINNSTHLNFYCFICKQIFQSSWKHIYAHHGCGVCNGKQIRKENSLGYLQPDLAKEWVSSKRNLTPFDVSEFSGEMVLWKCSICEFEWKTTVHNRSGKGKTGCPKCCESKGEKEVSTILSKYKIKHIPQYMFDGCKGIRRKLPFDFYLPNYNICIEYHGQPHYYAIEYFGGKDGLRERQRLDQIKEQYCYDNNIPLIIIPYWDFDNIESILTTYLNLQ